MNKKYGVIAVELSSLAYTLLYRISPLAACCINVSEDHIDWHGSYENYVNGLIKHVFTANTKIACIYNCEDAQVIQWLKKLMLSKVAEQLVPCPLPLLAKSVSSKTLIVDRAFIPNRQIMLKLLQVLMIWLIYHRLVRKFLKFYCKTQCLLPLWLVA